MSYTSEQSYRPREQYRICYYCGRLRPEESLTRINHRPDLFRNGLLCDTCIENGNTEPRYYRRHDGSFVEFVESVWAWCLDCEWETEIQDFPYDEKRKVETRAKRAGAGHIGNSEGCEDFMFGTFPDDRGTVGDEVGSGGGDR